MRQLLSLFFTLMATTYLWAYDFQSGDLYYNITSDSTVEVTYQKYYSSSNYSGLTSATIPETIDYNGTTYSVTSIGDYAFFACSSLTSITIPNSVTSIEYFAFYDCSSLTSVTIPNSVTSIGNSVFNGCSKLTSVTIGNSVTSIGSTAFARCSKLTSITIPNSVTSIGSNAFSYCSSLTSITIPNGVTSIAGNVFSGCSSLTSVVWNAENCADQDDSPFSDICSQITSFTLGDSVEHIPARLCYGMNNLKSITIPNSVTSIGKEAFSYCSSLTSITIPNSVISVEKYAFEDCSSLTSVVWNAKNCADFSSSSYAPFDDSRSQITSFTFGDSVEHIPARLCYGMNNLKSITIPNSVTSIGKEAFSYCSSLTSITIPNGVTSIENYAFNGCSKLTSITIPNSVTSIEYRAFSDCSFLTSITIPNSVTSIGNLAFSGCSSLTSVVWNAKNCADFSSPYYSPFGSQITSFTFGDSVEHIPASLCYGMKNLKSITIPNSVTSIGEKAFFNCNSSLISINVDKSNSKYDSRDNCNAIIETATNTLIIGCKNTIIPNGVTSIENYAFNGCSSLTSITIPNSVTSIGYSAFSDCSSLTSITIPNSVTSIGGSAFSNCSSLTSLTIPNSLTSIGDYAFYRCSSLTSVTIPNSVTSIGEEAFNGCYRLTSVTIGNSVTSIEYSAFAGCRPDTMIIKAPTPPSLYTDAFTVSIPICVIPCGTLAAYQASDWAQYVGEFVEERCVDSTMIITYTSADGNIVIPYYEGAFRANIISNTYENGVGTITFDAPVTSIGWGAFSYCSSLTSITIPNSVTWIGENAFRSCSALTSITIPENVTSIGDLAFEKCSSLTSITIPENVTSIGYRAFYYCEALTSITIPSSVTSIGDEAFWSCSSLTSVILLDGVTSIGENAFRSCSALTSITIPESVTGIGNQAFAYCSSLTSVTIGNSVTSIGDYAFSDCSSLTSVTIPNSVTSIGTRAFSGCTFIKDNFVNNSSLDAVTNNYWGAKIADIELDGLLIRNDTVIDCRQSVTMVVIPDYITCIGDYAFSYCSSLTSVTIPNSVTSIGIRAFSRCSSLTSVSIPNSVISIGDVAFDGTAIYHDDANWESGVLYISNCLIEAKDDILGSYAIKENTRILANYAFSSCSSLTSITIPESVTSIGDYAFSWCSSLTSITIPNSVTSIGEFAFSSCSSLDTIYVEATTPPTLDNDALAFISPICYIPCGTLAAYQASNWAQYVGEFVEGECTRIITYTSTDGNVVTPSRINAFGANIISNTYEYGQGVITFDGPVTKIGVSAFANASTLSSITIPNKVKKIEYNAFENCKSLTSITIPESVELIDERAFYSCSSLESIDLPEGVSHIGIEAFAYSGIKLITIPTTLKRIEKQAFNGCNSLAKTIHTGDIASWCSIVFDGAVSNPMFKSHNLYLNNQEVIDLLIPNTVDTIKDNAFCYGTKFKSITIPNSVISIGNQAFGDCWELETINWGQNIEHIGGAAFNNCSKLTSITLPESLITIGSTAFYACKKLISVVIPKNVTQIGNNAFEYCYSLESITCEAVEPPTIEEYTFNAVSKSIPVYVPCGSVETYKVAPLWNNFGNIQEPLAEYSIVVEVNDNTMGIAQVDYNSACGCQISAIPNAGYRFVEWSDGNIDNPRSLELSENTSLVANFEIIYLTPETATICYGDTYQWHDRIYDATGTYYDTLSTGLATLHLTVLPAVEETVQEVSICEGNTYTWQADGKVYSESGNYSITLQDVNGCDSVVILHLTVNPVVTTEEHITACDSYTWNGETYTESGEYVYTTTAKNGCDSIVTLHLTINQTQYAEETVTACDSYTWNGETYTESGEYVYTTTANNGCDSIITLHLTINNTQYAEVEATACDSYAWNGETYTESGEYLYTTTATNGCDSIVTLHLTINNTQYAEVEATACDSYNWNGEVYTQSGEYVYTTTATNGCDSIVTLHLTINNTQYAEESVVACDSYTWNGETYTESGDYTYTTTANNGCDSIVTLHLTINNTQYAEVEATACDSYDWNGKTYTESGEYTFTTTATNGCDSIVTLHLTINATKYTEETVTACDSYTWNGETYTASGEYTFTTIATNGCDSLVTLHLTINATKYTEETITACDSYTWNGETYTISGEYTHTTTASNGCDSIVTLHLTINKSEVGVTEYNTICYGETFTWNSQTYSTEGEYSITLTNALGCDSVATLHLTIMPEAITTTETVVVGSDEVPYTWRGNTYSSTGQYTDVEQYATVACDSAIYVLDLTVLSTGNHDEQSVTICETEAPYTWYGESYSATGKYTYTEKYSGTDIDSVQHILNLTVNPTLYTEKHVTACDSYDWNGETYTESGEYTYTTTATNGCDSIVTLHLTINQTQYAEETVVACDNYTWNGETYTESGEYTYTTTAKNGCDSIVTLHLTINATKYTDESVVACDSYVWNGQTYTASGEYTFTTTATNGCDSIVTLHLTINKSEVGVTEYNTICYGETFTWNGQTYTASGEYSVVLTNVNGCDSTVTLHLTIMPQAVTTTETIVIGSDELPYTWRGNTYSATGRYTNVEQYTTVACDSAIYVLDLTVLSTGNYDEQSVTICETEAPYTWYGESYSATGKYTYTEKYAGTDIDSVQHILNLTVNPTIYTEEHVTACDSYTWNGETYTVSGDYTYTTTAATGCDSIITLHLTINKSEYVEETATACDSYEWNSVIYTESGDYTYTTTTDQGCERVEVLHLTINKSEYVEETATACDSYEWNGVVYTESGDYTYTTTTEQGCERVEVLHLTINNSEVGETEYATICYGETFTWNSQTYSTEGEYSITLTNALGCDSVATLHLTIMPEAITTTETVVVGSDEVPYTWRGNTYSATGRYTNVEQYTQVDCDSAIYVLDLTVLSTGNYDEQSVTICETEAPYTWYGESYSATGKYTYTEKYSGTDIDSVQHILNLTVNPTLYTEEHITACDSYEWNGQTYATTGAYTYTTTATNGCDSIVTLHLTINKSEREEYTEVACDEYVWNGVTYTESGDYTYTTTTAAGCERVEVLHLTINKSEHVEFTETACDSYEWNGVVYTASGDYTYNTTTAAGCERIEVLHLTILPEAITDSEELVLCPSELPYEWYGQSITEAGTYSVTEPYAGMECDSVIHELTVNVYVHTLPATVTQPIVRTGEAIDITIPTAEIQAHIAAETWYAPNAEVAWYIMENSDWAALSAEPVAAGTKQVVLKYAVETDCGNIESDNMVIDVIPTSVENTDSQSPISNCQKVLYEDHIYILRDGKMYSIMGQEM